MIALNDKPSEPKDYSGDYNKGSLELTIYVKRINNTLICIKKRK
jgi:hypothetical protein